MLSPLNYVFTQKIHRLPELARYCEQPTPSLLTISLNITSLALIYPAANLFSLKLTVVHSINPMLIECTSSAHSLPSSQADYGHKETTLFTLFTVLNAEFCKRQC